MDVFRVFPWDTDAPRGAPGHPTFVSPTQGAGRIDNPYAYATLYVSDSAAGAISERLGDFSRWSDAVLGSLTRDGRVLALAHLHLNARILDLDAAKELLDRNLRPSDVATRDRHATQAWAMRIFGERRWSGLRWWSRFEARWGAIGLWDTVGARVETVEPLDAEHPAFQEAGLLLGRI